MNAKEFKGVAKECRTCEADNRQLKCDVCASMCRASHSHQHNMKNRNTHLRCQPCHTCADCKKETTADQFNGISRQCRKCFSDNLSLIHI